MITKCQVVGIWPVIRHLKKAEERKITSAE